MRRVYQVAGLIFFVGSVLVMWESRNLEYYTPLGPGAGFFPLWLSGILTFLSAVWLIQVSREPSAPMEQGFIPRREGALRILAILGATISMGLLMEIVGFQIMAFLFLLFLLLVLGRQNPVLTTVIAVAGSFGLYYAFYNYLNVPLPTSTIPFLMELGL